MALRLVAVGDVVPRRVVRLIVIGEGDRGVVVLNLDVVEPVLAVVARGVGVPRSTVRLIVIGDRERAVVVLNLDVASGRPGRRRGSRRTGATPSAAPVAAAGLKKDPPDQYAGPGTPPQPGTVTRTRARHATGWTAQPPPQRGRLR